MTVTLEKILDHIKEYLDVDEHFQDMLEYCLAVPIARRYHHSSLYGLLSAISGGGKSEILEKLMVGSKDVICLSGMTGQAMVSGYRDDEKGDEIKEKLIGQIEELEGKPDLTLKQEEELEILKGRISDPENASLFNKLVEGSGKTLIIPDLTLSFAHSQSKKILADFRIAHDGYYSFHYGNTKVVTFEGHFNAICGCTPQIDKYTGEVSGMGERWLYLRIPIPTVQRLMEVGKMAAKGGDRKYQTIRKQAKTLVHRFLDPATTRFHTPALSDADSEFISRLSVVPALFRQEGENGDKVICIPSPESTGRVANSLGALAKGLMAVNRTAKMNSRVEWLLRRTAFSTLPDVRRKMIVASWEEGNKLEVASVVNLFRSTSALASRALHDAFTVGLLDKQGKFNYVLSDLARSLIIDGGMDEVIEWEKKWAR